MGDARAIALAGRIWAPAARSHACELTKAGPIWPATALLNWPKLANWPSLGHPLVLVKPARSHSVRTLAGPVFDIEPRVNAGEGQLHDAALGGAEGGRVGLEQLVPRLDLVDEQLDEAQIVRARHSPLSLLVQKEQRSED